MFTCLDCGIERSNVTGMRSHWQFGHNRREPIVQDIHYRGVFTGAEIDQLTSRMHDALAAISGPDDLILDAGPRCAEDALEEPE